MSILGSIGKGILRHIPVIGPIAGDIAEVASALGSGRAQGRTAENITQGQYDQNRIAASRMMEDALMNRAGLDLQQRQFGLQAPKQRASNAVQGDILANVQDAQVQGPIVGTGGRVPTITGGLRPSLLSPNTRQLGTTLSRDALLQQMQGDRFAPLPPVSIPQITPPKQAGAFDKILGGIGLGGGLLSAGGDIASLLQKYGTKPKTPMIPYGDEDL